MEEFDEIKNAWSALDDRLKKNEGLNDRLIKEILHQKSNKSLSKLFNYDTLGLIMCLLVLALLIYFFSSNKQFSMYQIIKWSSLGIITIGIITQLYQITLLSRINLHKEIKDNIRTVQQYKVFVKKSVMIEAIAGSLFCCMCGLALILQNAEIWKLIIIIISLFGLLPLLIFWQYKNVYKNNIKFIQDSLEELNELDE